MTEIILNQEYRGQLREISTEQFQTGTLSGETNNAQKAFAVACIGAELGLSPLQSLRGIYIIKGKPILAAQTIHAVVVRRKDICKYLMLVESTREKATYETLREGDPRPTTLTYTIEDAKAAGLLNNPTWKSHPAAMLRNRCIAALCRAVYPDLAMGLYEESEGEEIRGSVVQAQATGDAEPLKVAENRRYEALPEAEPTPELHPAFAPDEPKKTELSPRQMECIAIIAGCKSISELNDRAAGWKAIMPEAERAPLREPFKLRLSVLQILEAAKLPDADKQALFQKAMKLEGLTNDQENELALALETKL